jgi:acyl carrier protein
MAPENGPRKWPKEMAQGNGPAKMTKKGGGRIEMDRPEIEARVKKVLAEQLAVDEAQVVPDARFAEDLNADSLDLVEAVLALEEEWNIEIPEDEMEAVKTVGQAVDIVASKLGVS